MLRLIYLLEQVHCQGGKGRSGTFCSSLLVWTSFVSSASEGLQAFAQRRADERMKSSHYQGVTGPSQIRYVNYIEDIVMNRVKYIAPPKTLITSIKIHSLPSHQKGIRISFIIESLGTIQYDYCKRHGLAMLGHGVLGEGADATPKEEIYFETEDVLVAGDVCVRFFIFEDSSIVPSQHTELGQGARTIKYGGITGKELCFVTFHTSFHQGTEIIMFERSEIDGVHDRPFEDFPEGYSICVTCQSASARSQRRARGRRFSWSSSPLSMNITAPVCEEPATQNAGNGVHTHKSPIISEAAFNSETSRIPYGTAPGLRFLRLWEVLSNILSGPDSTLMTFKQGQLMFDQSKRPEMRSLYMIVCGSAEYDHPESDERKLPSRINRGDSIAGLPLGVGDCYGEISFLLGHEGDVRSFWIRATSDVQV